jgi:hypothetical protein
MPEMSKVRHAKNNITHRFDSKGKRVLRKRLPMQITNYKPTDLIMAEYNPRQLTKEQHKDLTDSIKRFGLVDPLIVNTHKDRKNIVVGGHQRLRIAQELNIKEIPCVEVELTPAKERELNIRLNKNSGEWNWDELANHFDVSELIDWGFNDKDLSFFDLDGMTDDISDDGEIEFAEELLLEHNYIVLYFNNPLDWEVAKEKFNLKKVKSSAVTEKSQKIGIGRVINGKDYL